MIYTPMIEKALKKAAVLHAGQIRKNEGNIPYITHPVAVMLILSKYTEDENTLVAALLHDTVEDCDYTPEELEKDFGSKVRDIVMGVTEPKLSDDGQKLPWKTRKEAYLANLENDSRESMMVCAADKIHNMSNKLDDFEKYGESTFDNFASTTEEREWYHGKVYKILRKHLDSPILDEFQDLLEDSKKLLK